MDLRLYFRVIWRFRIIVGLGLVLACALSFFSYARISFKGGSPRITYRQPQTWSASALVFLTQKGFPYGYTVLPYTAAPQTGTGGGVTYVPQYGSPGTFSELAQLYAPFAESDGFRVLLRKRTHLPGVVQALTVLDRSRQNPQPYINVFGYAANPADAVKLANIGSDVFSQYVLQQEIANKIPASRRVVAETITRARQATISTGRKKTTPIVVFLTVLLAALGFSFVLENLRPRIKPLATYEEEAQQAAAATARESA
jgi:hypothetical protein